MLLGQTSNNPLNGQQEGRFFHGYYDCYCYLPLHVFCGQQLLCAYLRPSRIDGAKHAAAILKLLVTRLRQRWPQVRILAKPRTGMRNSPRLRACALTHSVVAARCLYNSWACWLPMRNHQLATAPESAGLRWCLSAAVSCCTALPRLSFLVLGSGTGA